MRLQMNARLSGVALAMICAACAPKAPTTAELLAGADALDKAFVEAFNRNDVDALMATYWNSPELMSIGLDGMGATGWEAVKPEMAMLFSSMPGARLEFLSSASRVEGNVVLTAGRFRLTLPAEGGPAQVMEGRFSDAKTVKDGKWVYVMDHASMPLLPPPQ